MAPPGTAAVTGQSRETAMAGAVVTVQVVVTRLVTGVSAQTSTLVPENTVVRAQALVGTRTVLVKLAVVPGPGGAR